MINFSDKPKLRQANLYFYREILIMPLNDFDLFNLQTLNFLFVAPDS